MADLNGIRTWRALFAGRWQFPLALLSLGAAAYVVKNVSAPPPRPDPAAISSRLDALLASGARLDAADAAANLLESQPPLPREKQIELSLLIARILADVEASRDQPIAANVRRIQTSVEAARALGAEKDSGSEMALAQASEWSGYAVRAAEGYRTARELAQTPEQRRKATQALLRCLPDDEHNAAERRERLDELVADDGVGSAYAWWALQQLLRDALRSAAPAAAEDVLKLAEQRFSSADRRGYFEHLRGRALVAQHRYDEALPGIEWVHQWLRSADIDREPERLGNLESMNTCLLAQDLFGLRRFEEALRWFDVAAREALPPEWQDAAELGRASTLAELDRPADAVDAFRGLIARTVASHRRPETPAEIESALRALSEPRLANGDFGRGLTYLALLRELLPLAPEEQRRDLLETVADGFRLGANSDAPEEIRVDRHSRAGGAFEQAAELAGRRTVRAAELSWQAAEEYAAAGCPGDARRALQRFVESNPDDPRIPSAHLQIADAFEGEGALEAAIREYKIISDRYPTLEEAAKARVRSAVDMMSVGPPRYAEAERLLLNVLERDQVTPESPLYRDALLNLGELLYAQQRFGEAIGRLDQFSELYADDPSAIRVKYLRADAYRRSALVLRDRPDGGERWRDESRRRMRQAATEFDHVAHQPETAAAQPGYARLATFRAADCLFELNTPEDLRSAMTAYRAAAARYPNDVQTLDAQVQVARALLRLGQPADAARALQKARGLLALLPDSAFARPENTRQAWKTYLDTLLQAPLLRSASAAR